MNIKIVFYSFCQALAMRKTELTEDNIRYYWFVQMFLQDNDLNKYCLEKKYSDLGSSLVGKELDLFYKGASLDPSICMEIKFHHKTNSSFAHTEAAGTIVADILRLHSIPGNQDKYFLYVTDDEMHNYLTKGGNDFRNKMSEIYTGTVANISYNEYLGITSAPSTFTTVSSKGICKHSVPALASMVGIKRVYTEPIKVGLLQLYVSLYKVD